jgi:formamidopyrimidine-DNA glycosylase
MRTFDPPLTSFVGSEPASVFRLGKRIVLDFPDSRYIAIHLIIAGRLLWKDGCQPTDRSKAVGKQKLAEFVFESGQLTLTEVSSKKRASIHCLSGDDALRSLDAGGLDPLSCSADDFRQRLLAENRTLKRALTNPRAFSGIGNAYSDEILHAARLSPLRLTRSLNDDEVDRLRTACSATLSFWTEKLSSEFKDRFPGRGEVSAFRPEFAAHGKFGQKCPECGMPIQRIRYEENETNYCARCQNEDRILADRSLSRLLKSDWPRTLEELVGE